MNFTSPGISSGSSSSVAYLGPEGTFAHAVAQQRFGSNSTLLSCSSIQGVFERVLSRAATSGIVPLENTSGGWIYDTVDLLIQNAPRIHIREELSLDVKLALVGRKGVEIKKIYSHFAPLKHYAKTLTSFYANAEQVTCSSTARAAQLAKEDPNGAALTSRQAALIYGLDVLVYPIDPDEKNVTSFVEITQGKNVELGQKLGLVVRLKNEPSSLLNFLKPFAEENMNLTRIISRPIHGEPSAHHFLVEVEARENEPKLKLALEKAEKSAVTLISLGNYIVKPRIDA